MQQQKKTEQAAVTNSHDALNGIRHEVKKKLDTYKQVVQKQQNDTALQLKQVIDTIHSSQTKKLIEMENDILASINEHHKGHSNPPAKIEDYNTYSETDTAEIEEQCNEMHYKETDFGEIAMIQAKESAGNAMRYTEEGLEKAMGILNNAMIDVEKITEGIKY
ncbi:MAG: hypothetical protein JST82_04250 [Bacteroidetes bacterium]|nr:hypothetical protein [Bacteroidota bacterium]